jgi:23S rRNA pseudouridine1911/1915/1917 synthase
MKPARALATSSPQHARLAVVFEDTELLVVNKPADLVCHPTKGDAWSSLVSRVRLYLDGAAEPQLIHRLDRETSGLVVFAKGRVAAAELRRLWERRAVAKLYLTIVHGVPAAPAGEVDAPLGRDPASAVAIKDCVRPDGAPARTRWRRRRAFRPSACSRSSR